MALDDRVGKQSAAAVRQRSPVRMREREVHVAIAAGAAARRGPHLGAKAAGRQGRGQ